MRELRRFGSASQGLRQLGDLSHVTFSMRVKWKIRRQFESQLGALEISYLLTVLKIDSMDFNFGYMVSYDCCCHHLMNANELWLCMITLVIISE
jgi:hypothetical protein